MHDTHIRASLVGDSQPDLYGNDLAGRPGLDVGCVVGELQPFAEPEVALCRVEVGRDGGEFGETFDVGSVVLSDGVGDGGPAGGG